MRQYEYRKKVRFDVVCTTRPPQIHPLSPHHLYCQVPNPVANSGSRINTVSGSISEQPRAWGRHIRWRSERGGRLRIQIRAGSDKKR